MQLIHGEGWECVTLIGGCVVIGCCVSRDESCVCSWLDVSGGLVVWYWLELSVWVGRLRDMLSFPGTLASSWRVWGMPGKKNQAHYIKIQDHKQKYNKFWGCSSHAFKSCLSWMLWDMFSSLTKVSYSIALFSSVEMLALFPELVGLFWWW